jgi:membrane-bound ClpP family serine protease
MAAPTPSNANIFIEQQLDERIHKIEEHFNSDAISFSGPILFGVDNLIRTAIETIKNNSNKEKLIVILTTTGGYIEVVQRIVDTLRHHYLIVDFIIPNYAYSAGTVLTMSGDSIHMDYYSRLGPIDPQVENLSQKIVPALGYLEQYSRLIKKAEEGKISIAEVQLLINGFDQAELYQYEQARKLSIVLLKEWLVKYKFKNWIKTETRRKTVTKRMKTVRAALIATSLNNTDKWHTHGHGISMEVLRKDLKLKIDDFCEDPILDRTIRDYYNLLDDYMIKRGNRGALHWSGSYQPFQ